MRKIKFRAWSKQHKEMLDVREIGFKQNGGIEFVILIKPRQINERGDIGFEFPKKYIDGNSLKLMQYTGLKDKNGKEIYEGDIIEMQHCDECNGLKAVVKRYWDGWWYFTEVETKGRMGEMVSQYVANFDEKFGELSYCIVIGNKYEDGDEKQVKEIIPDAIEVNMYHE